MRLPLLLILFACFALAGCADGKSADDHSRFGGFYGGINGGAAP